MKITLLSEAKGAHNSRCDILAGKHVFSFDQLITDSKNLYEQAVAAHEANDEDAMHVLENKRNAIVLIQQASELRLDKQNIRGFQQSRDLYIQAYEKGLYTVADIIGTDYYCGKGVAMDYEEAMKWYRRGASFRCKHAIYSLACANAYGNGTNRNFIIAYALFLISVANDIVEATAHLKIIRENITKDSMIVGRLLSVALLHKEDFLEVLDSAVEVSEQEDFIEVPGSAAEISSQGYTLTV